MDTPNSEESNDSDLGKSKMLLERHLRIKRERRNLLTTIIGLSGGAIVLSMSLLAQIAPKKVSIWLIIVAWCFLGLAVLFALSFLVRMTRRSMNFQRELEQMRGEGRWDPRPSNRFFLSSTPPTRLEGELGAGCLFVIGAVFLGIFAVVNLLAK